MPAIQSENQILRIVTIVHIISIQNLLLNTEFDQHQQNEQVISCKLSMYHKNHYRLSIIDIIGLHFRYRNKCEITSLFQRIDFKCFVYLYSKICTSYCMPLLPSNRWGLRMFAEQQNERRVHLEKKCQHMLYFQEQGQVNIPQKYLKRAL